jgi:hypothetical protein
MVRKVPEWTAILGLVMSMTPGPLAASQQPSSAAEKPAPPHARNARGAGREA